MENINVNVIIASDFDKKENSIGNIINEIDYSDQGNDIAVVIMLNGIYDKEEPLEFDFFIRQVGDEDETTRKKFLYLFSMEMFNSGSEKNAEKIKKACYPNWFFALGGDKIHIEFPEKGNYELEVFNNTNKEERDVKKRYREYRENKEQPAALYCFQVK